MSQTIMETVKSNEKLKMLFPTEGSIPPEYDFTAPIHQQEYLLNGKMVKWKGAVQEVYSPIFIRDGEELKPKLLGSYPLIGETEALEALESAEKAYNHGRGEWAIMSVEDRIKCVENFTNMMVGYRSQVVKLLMWEIGKSQPDAEKEFDRTVEYIYATIDELKKLDRESSNFRIEQGIIGQIRRSPLGIVLCMGPFNYPLNETYTMLIPALIMGNVVLFKPPRQGILLHNIFQEAYKKCFPKGVINFLYGRGSVVVPPLMASGKIDVLTLIGSSKMADRLQKSHPKVNRLRSVLGLDAKNAAIVLRNADIEATVKEVILGALSFNGQRCTAIKIVFVHSSIADNFTQKLSAAIANLKAGMPWEKGVNITPVAEPEKPDYIAEVVADAVAKGAKIVNTEGGEQCASFVYPTVVYPVTEGMTLYKEEQFGPVIPIATFDNLEQPINYLIHSDHGQQVSIFGTDAEEIAELIDPLVNQVTRVNINAQCQRGPDTFPFSGRKDSAQGTLSILDALRSFSIRSVVATKATPENKALVNEIIKDDLSNFLTSRFIF
jgi:acyl-CoA reductase-like NAD-dependent aldehyde dehydrogenase